MPLVGKKKTERKSKEGKRKSSEAERDARHMAIMLAFMKRHAELPFPIQVYPDVIREYIVEAAASRSCSYDLLCVPLLSVAGAAVGRAGKRVQIKSDWHDTSCLWTACLASSSAGKTPALRAVADFYTERHAEAYTQWKAAKQKDVHPPIYCLSDTTLESMRDDLQHGAVLYMTDELSSWTQSMGQYKSGGGGDRAAWTSFWSHESTTIGRKTEKTYLERPFVAVTGMMVPESAHLLNFRGNADDGFVHRMLIACPADTPLIMNPAGVRESLTAGFKKQMTRLFKEGPDVRFDRQAYTVALNWINNVHYPAADGPDSPDWLKAKYKKLTQNLFRVAFVLHEIWRACGDESGDVISTDTVERAIQVIDYFKEHIPRVQKHLGEVVSTDARVSVYDRLKAKHPDRVTVRNVQHGSNVKAKEAVLELFASWEKKGLGKVETGDRKDQKVFCFGR